MSEHIFVLPSSFEEADKVKEEVLQIVESKYSPEISSDFIFCFHEMLNNAIEHGNRSDLNKVVTIKMHLDDYVLRFVVEDQGSGFDWQKECEQEVDLLSERERGRGIYMSKLMIDNIKYNQKGNIVTCEKKV